MTPSDLKYAVESRNTESHYFTRSTMRAFGDTMANYGVRSTVIRVGYGADGNSLHPATAECEVWELYRKRPVKHGNKESAYFRKDNFHRTFPA